MARQKKVIGANKPRKKGYSADEIKEVELKAYRKGYAYRDQEIKDFISGLLNIDEVARYAADQAVYNSSCNCRCC